MTKTYISGPMTGIPGYNYPAFMAAAADLRAKGRTVVNPAENGLPPTATWHEHMRADIKELVDCDTIYLLPGWRNSKGARLEVRIAIGLGMKIESAEYEEVTV